MKRLSALLALCLLSLIQVEAANGTAPRKYVGIFYFVWLGQHPGEQTGDYDITKLLKNSPGDLYDPAGTPASPVKNYHFWGEPLYGYYNSMDPWVVGKHIELLTDAGIDYLMLDVTNAVHYPGSVTVLLDKLREFKDQGFDVPKVSFYTNTRSGYTLRNIYNSFFRDGKYADLFFAPEGKPLVVGVTRGNIGSTDQKVLDYVPDDLVEYFDVRESQWPTAKYDFDKGFPWMSWDYPQKIQNGNISVSVAQHSTTKILFSDTLHTRGRGYNALTKENVKSGVRSGLNFQNQWNTVFSNLDKVSNVFVTGWNEWVAGKYVFDGEVGFVDTFNEEFSRDIEMMKGGHGDSFYIQLTGNVRKFKTPSYSETLSPSSLPAVSSSGVSRYKDPAGDVAERDFYDFSRKFKYTDNSGRNDIVSVEVARRHDDIIFTVHTASKVTPYEKGDSTWMNILVKVGASGDRFFEYDYVVNRHPSGDGSTSVEKIAPSGTVSCGTASFSCSGNVLTVKVPLSSIGLSGRDPHFDFKIADHVTHPDDIMDYYVSGDSAPIGRLSYRF